MPSYMSLPSNKLTLGASVLNNVLLSAKVQRIENGFDSATIVLPSTSYYPSTVTAGTTVTLEVKDNSEAAYTSIFAGIVRFVVPDIAENNTLTLSCLGAGFGLGEMLVGTEYGAQSINGLDTLTSILTNASYGLIPKYVNKILASATESGFSYATTSVDTISDSLPYINFPYKPAKEAINDLIDLETAAKAGTAGAHWIVTTDNVLHVKLLTGSHTGWTKYYGNSQANATLTYGQDYTHINLEKMLPEANYIVYYGDWRRPSNGDAWTNNNASAWYESNCDVTDDTSAGNYKVNGASILMTANHAVNVPLTAYPSTLDWSIDFSEAVFSDFNIPTLNVWLKRSVGSVVIDLVDSTAKTFRYFAWNSATSKGPMADVDRWYHISIPVGDFANTQEEYWDNVDGAVWSSIAYISIWGQHGVGNKIWIDGLHFGDAAVCRVAYNSSLPGATAKMRLITDNIGKDDSLVAADDSGLMAQMAYAELLRLQKESTVGTVETPMIKDALPGQWLNIQSNDYRITKLTHTLSDKYLTLFEFTDDVTNGRTRTRFEQVNKMFAAARPEWQDRQASGLKAGQVDLRIARLAKDYA
jgi:hypothetical protein